jgi:hypothetical protein
MFWEGSMKRHVLAAFAIAVGATIGFTGATGPVAARDRPHGPQLSGAVILGWNETMAQAALVSKIAPDFDPLHESRMYAMAHLAMHDALNVIDRRYEPYAMGGPERPDASPEAAVAAAAHGALLPALRELPPDLAPDIDGAIAVVDAAYAAALDDIPDGKAKTQGIAIGTAAAQVMLALRTEDGANDGDFLDRNYVEGTAPGEFRFIGPNDDRDDFAAAPLWGHVTPFVFDDITSIRPRPPYPLDSRRYAADFNEVKTMGSIDSKRRMPDQTETALFWMESSPLRWNRIARSVAGDLDAWQAARLFGLLNAAQADGYIANWDSKYDVYNRWRPETAIQNGDDDTNRRTDGDPDWRPLRTNGATPEYDSGHSIEGAASAEVMRRILGKDRLTFTICSYTMELNDQECGQANEVTRTYHRLTEASVENGESRILLGWHFRNAVEVGRERGTMIGATTVRELLRPTH